MLYIHIPYCHRKCTYCAFYSAVTSGDKQDYVDALCKELALRKAELPHPLRTIYWGGGTPSLLSLAQIGQIVETIRANFNTSLVEEATLEANPEDLTPEFLAGLRRLNFFNRVSIGIQSFRDTDLRTLNRRHSAAQATEAVTNAKAAGFDNISIDLIYGLPNQTLADWRDNLQQLSQLPITHFSAYSLTVEEGTMLHKQIEQGRIAPAQEEAVLAEYEALLAWAQANGFEQYEISNFCQPGFRSRHNSRYWDRTPYLGAGAAAHSFSGTCRRWNVANADEYVLSLKHGAADHETESITPADAFNEYVMTALRTTAGIEKSKVPTDFTEHLQQQIAKYIAANLIEETPTHYRPTQEGLLHADGIAAELFASN